jgi:hypothetical protein
MWIIIDLINDNQEKWAYDLRACWRIKDQQIVCNNIK